MRKQFQHDFKRGEGLGSPIDGNEGKESMFDLVPLTRRRGIMSHRDGELFLSGQFLELFLPQPISCSIGTASISRDQQGLFPRIEPFATALPPPSDTLNGKLGGIMIDAHIHKPTVVDQIINPIRDGTACSQGHKVIDIDRGMLSFGLPLSPSIFKIAKQFLLLAVHRNDRMAFLFKLLAGAVDIPKLCIAIWMRGAFDTFLVDVQGKAKFMQDLCRADFLM